MPPDAWASRKRPQRKLGSKVCRVKEGRDFFNSPVGQLWHLFFAFVCFPSTKNVHRGLEWSVAFFSPPQYDRRPKNVAIREKNGYQMKIFAVSKFLTKEPYQL